MFGVTLVYILLGPLSLCHRVESDLYDLKKKLEQFHDCHNLFSLKCRK